MQPHGIGHQLEQFFDRLDPDALEHGALVVGGVEDVQAYLLRNIAGNGGPT